MIVAATYERGRRRARQLCLDPRQVRIVFDVEGATRLWATTLHPDEVVWDSIPHSYGEVVRRIVSRHIR